MTKNGEIRIYVACLAAYNNGYLHGAWIDTTLGEKAIWDQINEVLKTSPMPDAEEWAIHDYEGFEGLSISEYEGIQSVVEKAEFIEEHGRLGAEVVNHYGDFETAKRALEDDYAGQYDSLADFAQEITEETSEVPNHLQYYIDWERMGRDLEINDVLAIDMGYREVHVFWNR